jgi:serine/threonine protein kinase
MPELKVDTKIPFGQVLVGKYRVTREIGRGGMAAVYEAEQLTLGKKVAVKVLNAELSASKIVIERFIREARAAASVKSPNIVDIYDSGTLEDGRPFITMEMLEGETLYDRMTRIRLIDATTTVSIITQCAKGLSKAHAVGIVHRDLKPENIFLLKTEDGEELIKILDFGLAKFYAPVKSDEKTARLTREGAVFGTPAYMSPEQVKGQGSVDHRADLWALGCMTFECLTGRPVWNTDQGVAMTFASIAAAQLPVPSRLRPDLPPAFDEWFKKALERDASKRFQTARELADALARAFGGGPISVVSAADIDGLETLAMGRPPSGVLMSAREESGPRAGGTEDGGADPDAPTVAQRSAPMGGSTPGGPQREAAPSAVEMPPTASSAGVAQPSPRLRVVRMVVSGLALVASTLAAYWAWAKVLSPQIFTPVVQSNAVVATDGQGTAGVDAGGLPLEPKWAVTISEGQKLFSEGDPSGAQKKFKEAQEALAPVGIARAFQEQTRAGAAGTGPCKMLAFSHPRLLERGGAGSNAHLPTIAGIGKAAIVAWTDDHELPGHEHVYSLVVDSTGHPTSLPRDLTPEAADVGGGSLLNVGDHVVLLYGDKTGREAGVRIRAIDETGRIAGDSLLVGAARGGTYWPSVGQAPDGFFVAWQDDRDGTGDELFLRHLGRRLEPLGPEERATDYVGSPKQPAVVRTPSVAVASNALYLTYELDRDPKLHLIERMRLALGAPALATGLESPKTPRAPKKDRELGDVQLINEDKVPGSAPTIACGSEGCFLAWNGDAPPRPGGAESAAGVFVALIDPVEGKVVWRKMFAAKGAHPTLSSSAEGQVMVAYYEGGRVKMAVLTRDGVGPTSVVAHISGDQPRPSLASGRAGEWLVAWQDTEERHSEVYAARVVCK